MAAGPMRWAADVTDAQFRTLGALEVLAAVALIAAAALGAPILTALAAAGLALTMIGAIATHVRLGETTASPCRPCCSSSRCSSRSRCPVNDGRHSSRPRPAARTISRFSSASRSRTAACRRARTSALVRAAEQWPERPAISVPARCRALGAAGDADVRRAGRRRASLRVRVRRLRRAAARRRGDPVRQLRRADRRAARRGGHRRCGADQPCARPRTSPPSSCGCRARRSSSPPGPSSTRRCGRSHGGSPPRPGPVRSSRSAPPRAGGEGPELEPLGGTTVAYLATLARDASPDRGVCDAPRAGDLASYMHTGRHHRRAEARRAHARQRGRQRVDDRRACWTPTASCSPPCRCSTPTR